MLLNCINCKLLFEAKRKDTLRCPTCNKKNRSLQVMRSRYKKNPTIEIGVGSGRSKVNQPGVLNKGWKTGIVGYRRLIEKTECAYCKSTKHLVIHHLDENRYNNVITNLIVLCKSCHQKHHVKRCSKTGRFIS